MMPCGCKEIKSSLNGSQPPALNHTSEDETTMLLLAEGKPCLALNLVTTRAGHGTLTSAIGGLSFVRYRHALGAGGAVFWGGDTAPIQSGGGAPVTVARRGGWDLAVSAVGAAVGPSGDKVSCSLHSGCIDRPGLPVSSYHVRMT